MPGPKYDFICKIYGKEPENLNQVAEAVISTINHQGNRVLGFEWLISYNGNVSNTHSSPEGHPRNWGCKPNLPLGYPGCRGRAWIRYEREPRFGDNNFQKTNTHTGTGGGGRYDGPWAEIYSAWWGAHRRNSGKVEYPGIYLYSWQYEFFTLDWPCIDTELEHQRVIDALSGVKSKEFRHQYSFKDAETIAKDLEFIESCKKVTV